VAAAATAAVKAAAAATGSVGAAAAPGEAAAARGAAAPAEAEVACSGRDVGLDWIDEVNNGNTFRRRPMGPTGVGDDAGANGRGRRGVSSLERIGSPTAVHTTARSARAAAAVDTPA